MLHLFLSTLAMMGLTFLIGFFVAAIIKGIALAADSMDFYSSPIGTSTFKKNQKSTCPFYPISME